MTIDIKRMEELIKKEMQNQTLIPEIQEKGIVISVMDGIAKIFGLKNAFFSEEVLFSNNANDSHIKGMIQKINEDFCEAVIFANDNQIHEGTEVLRTREFVKVPVGKYMLGRAVNALGEAIDGLEPITEANYKTLEFKPVEVKAPNIMHRQPVCEPLQTGIKMIDALIPIGRGQREVIIGDRQTGKTSIAMDTIINQAIINESVNENEKVFCIYVAIGQKMSSVAMIIELLREKDALKYTTIVVAGASEAAPLQFIAPYAGCAIGEYYRDNGMHALIVYDDLSKHAVAYRQMSLLLRQPPGREAYPGDVFYLHSRLLERAAKLSEEYGGGSLTALPIIETQAGDVSAYIPTNVISITDGQIFLESKLFYSDIKPAINIGISVSRVGSIAQTKLMKKVSGSLKLELAQYREKEAFLQFASDLDNITKHLLKRGQILVELLKQNVHSTLNIAEQAISIFIGTKGLLDDFNVDDVNTFVNKLLESINISHKSILENITKDMSIDNNNEEKIKALIKECKANFYKKNHDT